MGYVKELALVMIIISLAITKKEKCKEYIYLQGKNIKTWENVRNMIQKDCVKSASDVYLSANKLTSPWGLPLNSFANLNFLRASYNELTCFPYDSLTQVRTTILEIFFDRNKISECDSDKKVVDIFPKLTTVFLSKNELTKLPSVVLNAPKLQRLAIDDNKIMTVTNFMYTSREFTLKGLILKGNPLACVKKNMWLSRKVKNLGRCRPTISPELSTATSNDEKTTTQTKSDITSNNYITSNTLHKNTTRSKASRVKIIHFTWFILICAIKF